MKYIFLTSSISDFLHAKNNKERKLILKSTFLPYSKKFDNIFIWFNFLVFSAAISNGARELILNLSKPNVVDYVYIIFISLSTVISFQSIALNSAKRTEFLKSFNLSLKDQNQTLDNKLASTIKEITGKSVGVNPISITSAIIDVINKKQSSKSKNKEDLDNPIKLVLDHINAKKLPPLS